MERIGGNVVAVPLTIVNGVYTSTTTTSPANVYVTPNYQSYCPEMAKFLSQVSGWSYSDKDTFKNKLSYIALNEHTILTEASYYETRVKNDALFVHATAQLILSKDKTIAVISFRGTELFNPLNWLTDASTKMVQFFNIKVHLGFKRNLEAVWFGSEGIFSKMVEQERQENLEAIYITGHSLGGAMAVLAGLCLHEQHALLTKELQEKSLWNKVRGIYTYGQPMVVYDKDQNILHCRIGDRVFRHIYYNDIIPHLPPLSVGTFDHVGDEYKYHPNDGWKRRTDIFLNIFKKRATQVASAILVLPALGYDIFWDNVQWKLSFTKSPWSIADHNPGNYMDNW
jgi:Lipase (class 3)